jgi:plasmid stability protein
MTDLLIRDLDPAIEQELKKRARKAGESLSNTAQALLRRAILREIPGQGFGTELRNLAARHGYFDLEIERDKSSRPPPDFS